MQPLQCSASDRDQHNWDVLILDQTGWLPVVYGHAAVVVIGGSFVNHGGHNLLEAAAQRRAIIIGPHVQHFESVVEEFHRAGAILWLHSHLELSPALHSLLGDSIRQIELGQVAGKVLESRRGAARHYAHIVLDKLEKSTLPS